MDSRSGAVRNASGRGHAIFDLGADHRGGIEALACLGNPSAFPQTSWGEGGVVTVGLIPHRLGSDEEQGSMDKWNFIVLYES